MTGSATRTDRRRALALLGALALALAVVALVVFATGGAAEAKPPKFRTVTKTFSSNAPISIPEGPGVATPYPSQRNSGGFKRGKILDVNLTLKDLSHSAPMDVEVVLQGPGGRDTAVMADLGSFLDVQNATLVLDDEAPGFLPESTQITGGRFRPTVSPIVSAFPTPAPTPPYSASLKVFDGANANGTWNLFVFDDEAGDSGSIAGGFSVTIKAKVRR